MSERIDIDTPTLLSDEQLDARAEAIAAAFAERGLQTRFVKSSSEYPHVRATHPTSHHYAKIYLDDEGGADWEIQGDSPEGFTAAAIVAAIAARLG